MVTQSIQQHLDNDIDLEPVAASEDAKLNPKSAPQDAHPNIENGESFIAAQKETIGSEIVGSKSPINKAEKNSPPTAFHDNPSTSRRTAHNLSLSLGFSEAKNGEAQDLSTVSPNPSIETKDETASQCPTSKVISEPCIRFVSSSSCRYGKNSGATSIDGAHPVEASSPSGDSRSTGGPTLQTTSPDLFESQILGKGSQDLGKGKQASKSTSDISMPNTTALFSGAPEMDSRPCHRIDRKLQCRLNLIMEMQIAGILQRI